jgi:predicted permease
MSGTLSRGGIMSGFLNDLRFALRQLIRHPGFALAAILTLALGIGANTAVFSLLNGYLLKPLPYPHSDRLVQLNEHQIKPGIMAILSIPNYLSIKQDTRAFSTLGAYSWQGYVLQAGGRTQRVHGLMATASLFDVLDVKPYLGHIFNKTAQQPGRGQVVVLSYSLWQQIFGADPDAIGRTIKLNGQRYTVVGVMPKGFSGFGSYMSSAKLWTPYVFTAKMKSEANRRSQTSAVLGRLKPGVSLQQARRQLTAALHRTISASASMKQAMQRVGLKWIARPYHDVLVGNQDTMLYLLQGAVLLVLLIACVNVANLLLARILGRTHELAMRSALGASRGVLARQLLVEGLYLALPGGALGVALGWWSLGFVRQLGLGARAGFFNLTPDWHVALFALAVVTVVTLAISLLPIRHLSRSDLQSLLQEGGHSVSGGRGARRIRNSLVVAEIALATALLAGAGFLLHSFIRLTSVNPGFQVNHILTAQVLLPAQNRKNSQAVVTVYQNALKHIRALPGVTDAGLTWQLPLTYGSNTPYTVEGRPDSFSPWAWINLADGHYFNTLGLHLLRGRLFGPQDTVRSRDVVVVDRVLAQQAFPNGNPIGRRIDIGGSKATVIGVVSAIRAENLAKPNDMGTVYADLNQQHGLPKMAMGIVVKTPLPPASQIKPIHNVVARLNPAASISNFQSMHDLIASHLQNRQAELILALAFGSVALTLAVIGVYGVMRYAVEQRRAECGIRLALGARPIDLLWLIVKDGLKLLVVGLLAGLALAVVFGYIISSQLFDVAPFDPLTLIGVAVVLCLVTLAACYLPARRAARLDPAIAMMDR